MHANFSIETWCFIESETVRINDELRLEYGGTQSYTRIIVDYILTVFLLLIKNVICQ